MIRTVQTVDRSDSLLTSGLLQELLVSVDAAGTLSLSNITIDEPETFTMLCPNEEISLQNDDYQQQQPQLQLRLPCSSFAEGLFAPLAVYTFVLSLEKYLESFFNKISSRLNVSHGAKSNENYWNLDFIVNTLALSNDSVARDERSPILKSSFHDNMVSNISTAKLQMLDVPLFAQGLAVQSHLSMSDVQLVHRFGHLFHFDNLILDENRVDINDSQVDFISGSGLAHNATQRAAETDMDFALPDAENLLYNSGIDDMMSNLMKEAISIYKKATNSSHSFKVAVNHLLGAEASGESNHGDKSIAENMTVVDSGIGADKHLNIHADENSNENERNNDITKFESSFQS